MKRISAPRLETRTAALAMAALLCACEGAIGTISVAIVTAPESTVMDEVVRGRLTLSNPLTVVEADVDAGGHLLLDLEVVAEGPSSILTFEGFDAADQLVALGHSPALPIASVDAEIALYVATPLSLAAAPVVLEPPRSELGVTTLGYGTIYIGGRNRAGSAVSDVNLYNVYDHAFQIGDSLPEPRTQPTLMTGANGQIYIFGGRDIREELSAVLWRFDTNVAPAGFYDTLRSDASLVRAGAAAAPLGQDTFLVTGDPLIVIEGLSDLASAVDNAPALAGTATTFYTADIPTTLFTGSGAGSTFATTYVGAQFSEVAAAPAELNRSGHSAVVLADGDILIVGGDIDGLPAASAVRYDIATREFSVISALLAVPRTGAAIATTPNYLVVAGGLDAEGALVADAEVFTSDSLSPVASLPMVVPRVGAVATNLGNQQVIIVGGSDADGTAVEVVELFTPPAPGH